MTTTVVNIKTDEFDVYIGRRMPGMKLPASQWQNIYKITRYANRDDVLALFEGRMRRLLRFWYFEADEPKQVNIDGLLDDLRGKRLGCWCKPLACHGDLLARLADMSHDERREWAGGE